MTDNILVHGLPLCHKDSDGYARSSLPDVLLTPVPGGPPAPMGYINYANSKDLINGSKAVRANNGKPIGIMGSKLGKSIGGEPGTLGGIKSGTYNGAASWLTCSLTVKIEGKGAETHMCKMLLNDGNTLCCWSFVQGIKSAWRWLTSHKKKKIEEYEKELNELSKEEREELYKEANKLYDLLCSDFKTYMMNKWNIKRLAKFSYYIDNYIDNRFWISGIADFGTEMISFPLTKGLGTAGAIKKFKDASKLLKWIINTKDLYSKFTTVNKLLKHLIGNGSIKPNSWLLKKDVCKNLVEEVY